VRSRANFCHLGTQQLGHAGRNIDTAERNGKSDPVADISPDGDVVLVVGPWNVRLRIHSQCLRCASKVFGAVFGPHWSEGQGLSKESPREVPLVEDDADALRTICCVIHYRNDNVPQAPDAKRSFFKLPSRPINTMSVLPLNMPVHSG
jgi:hypothetical protein